MRVADLALAIAELGRLARRRRAPCSNGCRWRREPGSPRPSHSPSTRMIRLSPSLTSGRKRCTTQGSRKVTENRSNSDPKFGILHANLEHRRAAVSVERLHDDLAMLGAERLDLVLVARDQRRRHQIGEFENENLFRRIAHLRWIVDDQRLADGCARGCGWW